MLAGLISPIRAGNPALHFRTGHRSRFVGIVSEHPHVSDKTVHDPVGDGLY